MTPEDGISPLAVPSLPEPRIVEHPSEATNKLTVPSGVFIALHTSAMKTELFSVSLEGTEPGSNVGPRTRDGIPKIAVSVGRAIRSGRVRSDLEISFVAR